MPTVGKPASITRKNPFKNIKLAQPIGEENTGEVLNRLSGNKGISSDGVKYVDGKKHNKMGKNEFLKLLSYQLQNQDPLDPMDQKKFAADLAQFSQLEQMTNMNTSIQKLTGNTPTQNKFYAASFLGKEVTTAGTSIKYDGLSRDTNLPFVLPKSASKAIVKILDKNRQLIKQIEVENLPKGFNSISWDGMRLDGVRASKNDYHVDVTAWDQNLMPFKGETRSKGRITGVSYENDETIFILDGQKKVYLRDVESFAIPRHNNKNDALSDGKITSQAQQAYMNNSEN